MTGSGTVSNSYYDGGQDTLTVGAANGSGTFAGVIMGTGAGNATYAGAGAVSNNGLTSVTKMGTGIQVLTGSNTYAGATIISGGTLQIGNGGSGASIGSTSSVLNNGSLVFNHSDAVTFSPGISGSGSLTQAGTGTLTLAAANTYAGATVISGGTLQLNPTQLNGMPAAAVAFNFNSSSGTASGSTVNNAGSLSSAYNATLANGATIVPGVGINGGNALSISGNQYLAMNINVSLASGNWTASAWFYGLYNDGNYDTLFRGSAADHQIIVTPQGYLGTYLSSGGAVGPIPGVSMTGYYGQQAWNQVTAVASGGTSTSFYIDGNFMGSMNYASTSDIFAIGNWQGGGQPFAQYVERREHLPIGPFRRPGQVAL